MQHDTALLFGTATLLAMCIMGCGRSGDKVYPVSGKVTFQGKPVSAGLIRFSNPQGGIDMTANLRPDGTYEVVMARGAGLPEGTYHVTVLPPMSDPPIGIMKASKPKQYPDIPEKYRRPETSGLTLTVKPGLGTFDIDMQSR